MTTGELQPEMPPLEMPSTRPVSPIRNVTVPSDVEATVLGSGR